MKPLSFGSLAMLRRGGLLAAVAAVAIASAGCERALQVAPSGANVSIIASSTSVPLNGTVEVTATLTDNGGAVRDGTLVTFSSTLGTFEPLEATTANGRASVRFRAGTVSGTAQIVASSGAMKSSPLDIRVGTVPTQIVMSATQASPGSMTVVATVFGSDGAPVVGAAVSFTTTAGTLASSAATTNSGGQAANTLFGTGDAVVTASVGGIQTSIVVRFGSSGTFSVNIGVNPITPQRRQTVVFTATVSGFGGAAVLVERYEWDFGNGEVFVTTGNTVSKAWETQGQFGVTVRVYAAGGAVGISRVEFYVQ